MFGRVLKPQKRPGAALQAQGCLSGSKLYSGSATASKRFPRGINALSIFSLLSSFIPSCSGLGNAIDIETVASTNLIASKLYRLRTGLSTFILASYQFCCSPLSLTYILGDDRAQDTLPHSNENPRHGVTEGWNPLSGTRRTGRDCLAE